jgi:hypothetical protein
MTKDEILSMAKQAHRDVVTIDYPGHVGQLDAWTMCLLERFAALVAEKEREACAIEGWLAASNDCEDRVAAAIRARGQKEYRGARLVLTKDGVIQDGWMGDK